MGTHGLSMASEEVPQGTGSGFLWDEQHIVTNFHVIKDAMASICSLGFIHPGF